MRIKPSKLFMFGFMFIAVFGFIIGFSTRNIYFGLMFGCGGSILFTSLDLINICAEKGFDALRGN